MYNVENLLWNVRLPCCLHKLARSNDIGKCSNTVHQARAWLSSAIPYSIYCNQWYCGTASENRPDTVH